VNILAQTTNAVTTEYLTAQWRHANGVAVAHLLAARFSACGCTPLGECQEGQALIQIAEDFERRLALVERRWA
jgi:hypothetical protein